MHRQPDLVDVVDRATSSARRAIGARSPLAFAKIYLPQHFRLPLSRMHREILERISGATATRNARIAVAAPRGHAKSTMVSLAYVLWSVLYQKEMFVLMVSANRDLAIGHLRNVRKELEDNSLIQADFPEACPATGPVPKPWKDVHIALASGPTVRALGAGQGFRGYKFRQARPTLIVVDDLEDPEHTGSEDQRRKLRQWFTATLLKAGTPTVNVVVVGTILHYDSLLANLVGAGTTQRWPGWDGTAYRAVESFSTRPGLWATWESVYSGREEHDNASGPEAALAFFETHRSLMLEGTRVLWPELEDYRALMEMRVREGRASFDAEKQNEPVNPDECLFREEHFRYWDDEFADAAGLLAALGANARIVGAWDPSMGRRGGRGDLTAVVTLAIDRRDGTMYVIDADLARRTPSETIARIVALAGVYRYEHFGVEANGFQELIVKQLKDALYGEGRSMRIEALVHSTDKKARIEALEPLVNLGKIRFCRRHSVLLDQLRQYPLAAHDDGPDALEMAVHSCRRPRPRITVG